MLSLPYLLCQVFELCTFCVHKVQPLPFEQDSLPLGLPLRPYASPWD